MSQKIDINDVIAVQTSLKMLKPGMYAFHYVQTIANAPRIPLTLSLAPVNSEGTVEFLCPEGVERQTLAEPGDYIVISVRQGSVVIAVNKYLPRSLKGQVPARVRIESLSELFNRTVSGQAEAAGGLVAKQRTPSLSLLGHIERRGDVAVEMGQWLGDPMGRARIEGIRIDWSEHPAGVDIACACVVAGRELRGTSGQFIGTRAKAAPIDKIGLRLVGEQAARYQLTGEAAFSDGTRQPLRNGRLVGSEEAYLVAIRLQLTMLQVQQQYADKKQEKPESKARSAWTDPTATRIVSTAANSD